MRRIGEDDDLQILGLEPHVGRFRIARAESYDELAHLGVPADPVVVFVREIRDGSQVYMGNGAHRNRG